MITLGFARAATDYNQRVEAFAGTIDEHAVARCAAIDRHSCIAVDAERGVGRLGLNWRYIAFDVRRRIADGGDAGSAGDAGVGLNLAVPPGCWRWSWWVLDESAGAGMR
jgi:hypothetical protein